MSMESRANRGRLLRPTLLVLFGVLATIVAIKWWQVRERERWLQSATIEDLATAAYKNPEDVAVFERLGALTLKDEQWHRAARAYQHACEIAPDRVENWVGWARSIYSFGGFRAADAILTSYIEKHPRESHAYMERAA